MLAPISDDQKRWVRKLGRAAVSRLVLATLGAIGAKLGERIAETILGPDEDDEDDDGEKPE